jgi:hypothetical protein
VFDVQRGASPFFGVHIPFLCWACDFTAAFETFHHEFHLFARWRPDSGHGPWMLRWIGGKFRGISPCPTERAAMARPYMIVGI